MEIRKTFLKLMIGTVISSALLLNVGCSGGGFDAQDTIRGKETETITATEIPQAEQPGAPQVPEILNPDESDNDDVKQSPDRPEGDSIVLNPAQVCSEEYREKHNEIYGLLLKLAAFGKSEKTKERTEQGLAILRESDQKCKAFEVKFSGQACKAKLKSKDEPVEASYNTLLKQACESIAEGIKQLDATSASDDPSVDPTENQAVLNQDLLTLMKDQIIELKIPKTSVLVASSNNTNSIEFIWSNGQVEKKSLSEALQSAIVHKKHFCAVSGFADIGGTGIITHRAVSATNLDSISALQVIRLDLVSYLTGAGAGDQSQIWTVTCYGLSEVFQPSLASITKIMGQSLEVEIVGPVK
jgi:hypothetical protein